MNHVRLILLLGLVGTATAARAGDDAKVEIGDLRQGARLFEIHCRACHGPEGRGKGLVVTEPSAPALDDPARMTLLSDQQIFTIVQKGTKSKVMPSFGDALDDLEIWDLVAYLRSRHLGLTDFYPNAESFFGDVYVIDQWGLERHQALTGKKIPKDENHFTVLGVFKGTQGPQGPRLIPDNPLALAKIDRRNKIGYVVFVWGELPGIRGRHLLGISMDKTGLVWKIRVNTDDARLKRKIEKMLSVWEGYGRKGMKEPFRGGPSKRERAVARAWTEIYSRAMEAVVMYDKAERERHWADADFGGPAEPEATVEGGILKVGKNKKKHRRRKKR
jgi:mono/diheme cytochrome c family protein